MATTAPRTSVPRDEYVPSGWISFAGIMLFVAAFFSSIWGLAAILNDEVVTVGGRGVMVLDFTTWGWVSLVLGVIMGLTAGGLLSGRGWARVVAIVFVTLNAMAQVAAAVSFLVEQQPRALTHELVVTPAGERWVP